MTSERTLRKWRKEALHLVTYDKPKEGTIDAAIVYDGRVKMSKRILCLTQELLDQHLMRR